MSDPSSADGRTAAVPRLELRHNCVSLVENFAQTLGVLSPAGAAGVTRVESPSIV